MRSKIGFIAVSLVVAAASGLIAEDYGASIPEEVSLAADRVAAFVIDTVPHSKTEPAVVAVRGVELEGRVPPFGELFAITVASRISNAAGPGLEVRSHLPVDSYLGGFACPGP